MEILPCLLLGRDADVGSLLGQPKLESQRIHKLLPFVLPCYHVLFSFQNKAILFKNRLELALWKPHSVTAASAVTSWNKRECTAAKAAGRSQFGQMVSYLKEHRDVRHLLVEKTDRLYCNFRDYLILEDLDLIIHLVKENEVLSKDSRSHTKFIHGIKVLMAKNYVDNLSEEVKKGMDQKAAKGEWPSKAPIGYVRNTSTHKVDVDTDRAPLIRQLFESYDSGRYSLNALVDHAIQFGLRTVKGHKINKAGIHRILTNIFYTGDFIYKGKRTEGVHEPIVPVELFQDVQRRLRHGHTPDRVRYSNPFRGLVKCHKCGCSLTPDSKKSKYIYYRCTEYKGPCKNSISEGKLAELLGDIVRRLQIPPEVAEDLKAALKEGHAQKEQYHREAVKNLQKQYELVKNRLEKAYENKLDGLVDDKPWRKKSQEWNAELIEIEAALKSHREANRSYLEIGGQIIELARQAYDLYQKQDNRERRRLLDFVVSECSYKDGTLYVTYRKPFNLFVEGVEIKKWRG